MNLPTFPKPRVYELVTFSLLALTVATIVVMAVFYDNHQLGRPDALSSGPYVIERIDDITGVQLFAMPKDESTDNVIHEYPRWTPDLGLADRFGTLAQAINGRDRIGAGHVAIVREVVR